MTRGRQRRVRAAGRRGRQGRARQARAPRRWRWCASPATRTASRTSSPGGQRQRVALARAIVNRPRVLLLDEPLGALDLKLREQMQVELKGIQGEVGITFIYVTHDQDEALTMATGSRSSTPAGSSRSAPPAEIYEQPAERVRRRLRRRLEHARARRPALHDPPREDPSARERAAPQTACTSRRGRSPTSPTRAWSPATSSRSKRGESFKSSARTSRRPPRRRSSNAGGK